MQPEWVLTTEVSCAQARYLLLVLAECDCIDYWMDIPFSHLEKVTLWKTDRIKQAANELWATGHLEVNRISESEGYEWHIGIGADPPSVSSPPQTPPFLRVGYLTITEGTGAHARTRGRPTTEQAEAESDALRRVSTLSPLRRQADHLVKAWWVGVSPPPSIPFIGAVKLVERFLKDGWTEVQLKEALYESESLTRASLDYVLRRGKRKHDGPPRPPTPTDQLPDKCKACGSTGRYRSEAGWICTGCEEPLN